MIKCSIRYILHFVHLGFFYALVGLCVVSVSTVTLIEVKAADKVGDKTTKTSAPLATPGKIPNERTLTFRSSGKPIRTEWFYPPDTTSRPWPVLIILHGSGGIETSGGFFRDIAEQIARSGTIVVVLHYMDRTSISWANNQQMSTQFQPWLQTIHDAIGFVIQQKDVDAKRISLFGHSLGGQLGLHEASADPRVHSVAVMAGCFVLTTGRITRMPEVLFLQGTADKVVTLKREQATIAVLKRCGTKYEEHLFPHGDHMFQNVPAEQLTQYTIKFLKR